MNRAERRAGTRATRKVRRLMGAYSPIAVPGSMTAPTPRYVRRHMAGVSSMATRRARKVRARIARAFVKRYGS